MKDDKYIVLAAGRKEWNRLKRCLKAIDDQEEEAHVGPSVLTFIRRLENLHDAVADFESSAMEDP